MSETSKPSALSARLKRNIERRRGEIEKLTASELRKLAASLQGVASDALRSIASDTERQAVIERRKTAEALRGARQEAETLRSYLKRAWLRPLMIGLSLFLGILLGSWGLTQWVASKIEVQLQTWAQLEAEIKEQELTLERLREKTWGVSLHEGSKGRYVVLPWGAELDTRWTIGGRPSVRFLSR